MATLGKRQTKDGQYIASKDVRGAIGPAHAGYLDSLPPAPAGTLWCLGNVEVDLAKNLFLMGIFLIDENAEFVELES